MKRDSYVKRIERLFNVYFNSAPQKFLDAPESDQAMIRAIVKAQAAPSYDFDDIVQAIREYGDARVKESKRE